MKNVYKYIESLDIRENDYVVCAVSGGPDSMCLLHILIKLKEKLGFNIVCAHINHNLRVESNDEEVFVKNYCKEHSVIFEYMKILNYEDDNFHNDARNKRYNFYNELVHKYKANYLFTAHHGDDLMETVLMRIVRGSTVSGYGGFSVKTKKEDYEIVRPLITVTKEHILEYNEQNGIKYAIDKSNFKDVYTRNRYRKYILPPLKEENKDVHLKFYMFSEYMIETGNYLKDVARNICREIVVDNMLLIDKFKSLDHIIQVYIIFNILQEEYGSEIHLINKKHVDNIIKILNNSNGNKEITLPNRLGIKEYNYFYIKKIYKREALDIIFENTITLSNGKVIEKIDRSNQTDNNIIYLNSQDLSLPLHIRYRKNGDKLKVKNMNSYQKINDIFINEKIPKDKRDSYPIVLDDKGEIIWLPGLKKSYLDSQNSGKYDIILRYR